MRTGCMPPGTDPGSHQPVQHAMSTASSVLLSKPAPALTETIAGYWRGRGTVGATYLQLPDGCVDIVIRRDGDGIHADVYGTSTAAHRLPVHTGADYVGIRLHPGRARDLMLVPAQELTDACEPLQEVSALRVPQQLQTLECERWPAQIDAWLHARLDRRLVSPSRLDRTIARIQAAFADCDPHHRTPTITDLANVACLGRRQFERRFREEVGVSPHRFIAIARFRRACALLARPGGTIADVAHACGYSDHSHLVRAFREMAAMPPSHWSRHVANVQDLRG